MNEPTPVVVRLEKETLHVQQRYVKVNLYQVQQINASYISAHVNCHFQP